MTARIWRKAEDAELLACVARQMTTEELADRFQRSLAAIRTRVSILDGGPLKTTSRPDKGGPSAARAAAEGVPDKPKGYPIEQFAWAVDNNGEHPEAGLMLLLQREFEARARAQRQRRSGRQLKNVDA